MASEFHWYELRTSDPKAATAFYTKVIGWGTMDAGSAEHPYTVMTTDKGGVAGIGVMPPVPTAKPGWIGYVAVDDVDAYADKLAKAGGVVHTQPADIPGILRFADVADSQGTDFVIYHGFAAEGPPTGGAKDPGYAGWRELVATEAVAAFDFYSGLFGWTKTDAFNMGPIGIYQLFSAGAENIGGMMTQPDKGEPPHWNYYFRVDAVGAAIERLKAAGGTVINGPHPVPSGDFVVQARDPQGLNFHLMSVNP
jgi:predicted enzyme related to lactoylglutathione lyase